MLIRPIDLEFLDGQVASDTALRREVLALFIEEARKTEGRIVAVAIEAAAGSLQLRETLHRLRGSARAIGAGVLAAEAEALESLLMPSCQGDESAIGRSRRRLLKALDKTCRYAASLLSAK